MRKQKVNKKYLNEKYIEEQGITLIALVITIIVMLILAGISLNLTIGENGILMQARNAKIAQEDAIFNEKKESILFEAYNMKREGKSDEEIEAYLKQAFSELGERTVVSKVGDEWLIVSDERIVKSKLDGVTENNLVSKENVGTSEEWTVLYDEQGYLTIIGSAKTSGNVIIPQVITYEKADGTEGVGTVKQIGAEGYNVFSYRVGITNVTIPEGVQVIYNNSFYECSGLNQEINFPSTLTTIGDYAFYNCSGLTGNIIEKLENSRITKVGSYAFYGCKGLTGELKLFDNISMGAMTLAGCEKITGDINILLAEGLTEIPDGAFSGMSGLTGTPNIPATVKKIGNDAFNNCRGLTGTLTIPSICESIGDRAFYECIGLTLLELDTSSNAKLQSIGNSAFGNCYGFQNVGLSFPDTIKEIGELAFISCTNFSGKLILPKLETIEHDSFSRNGFNSVEFNNKIKNLGIGCFYGMKLTGNIEVPANIINLGQGCFRETDITSIKFLGDIKVIPTSCFQDCKKLEKFSIPDSVKKIEATAFQGCISLSKLGNNETSDIIEYLKTTNVTNIGNRAFSGCSALTGTFYNKLTTKAGTCTLGSAIFSNTQVVTTINLADGLELLNDGTYKIKSSAYTGAINLTGKIDLSNIPLDNGQLATITQIGNNAFDGCSEITEIIVPDTVTQIGEGAFRACAKLASVKLSTSITKINAETFLQCSSLTTIKLPENITSIEVNAFTNSGLTKIDIPDNVIKIGSYAFSTTKLEKINFGENSKLTTTGDSIFVNNQSLVEIELPSKLTTIANNTFKNCIKLESVKFKGDIIKIDKEVFHECRNLKKITFTDTAKIQSIGDNAFYNCTSLNLTLRLSANVSIGQNAFKDRLGNNLSGIKLEFVN